MRFPLALGIVFSAFFIPLSTAGKEEALRSQIEHPEFYLKISDWSFYVASRVAIIHHVTIENTADIAYKDIKVKVYYYSTSYPNYGRLVSSTTGVLPVTVPPKSRDVYLKDGITLGAGSLSYRAKNIEVLGATPIR
ncbi:MAG: hypothetical protein QXX77_10635 [Candidatus Methanosuratincola sp.]|jgi:hypothetical protein